MTIGSLVLVAANRAVAIVGAKAEPQIWEMV
jgi:hypothetical protein